jgi:hypothetical protein
MKSPLHTNDNSMPVSGLVPVAELIGDDEEETSLLKQMSQDAEVYLRSFSWCTDVCDSYFGGGVGGIFAVFLFNIQSTRTDLGRWIWIIVGDLPSAYLPIEDARSPKEVFNTYISGMNKWVELARLGRTGTIDDGVPPVNVPPTPEWAEKLQHRLNSLALIIKPFFDEDAESDYVN